jgi:hypothetical protein
MSFQKEINRLAGTSGLEAQRAANILAGTTGKELLFCLNKIAGTSGKEFNRAVGLVALQNGGSDSKDANLSFDNLSVGAVIVGGFDALIRTFNSGFGGTWAFYDAGGLSY